MKTLIKETENEGFMALLGKTITVYCVGFIYTGELVGVNDDCIKLSAVKIVYDTGSHSSSDWETAEPLPHDWYIQKSNIESFGVFK